MSLRLPDPARALASALLLALASCGGAAGHPAAAAHGAGTQSGDDAPNRAGSEAGDEPADPAAELCSDGSCFRCGEGVCPVGFYCDEKAPAGAACGWLPECTKDADCACVQKILGGACRCEVQAGGLHVTCD